MVNCAIRIDNDSKQQLHEIRDAGGTLVAGAESGRLRGSIHEVTWGTTKYFRTGSGAVGELWAGRDRSDESSSVVWCPCRWYRWKASHLRTILAAISVITVFIILWDVSINML
jgi:hypothetical protein